jgi:phenylpyruvate tautomerase PptA (4-oxalocrotonate tautomerase family)
VPHVRIEIVKGRSLEKRRRLLQAVHDALMEAFRIPYDDRTQRIVEHEPENFEIPPGEFQSLHTDRDHRVPRPLRQGEAESLPGPRPEARRDRHRPDGRLGRNSQAQPRELGASAAAAPPPTSTWVSRSISEPEWKGATPPEPPYSVPTAGRHSAARGLLAVEALARPCLTELRMLASMPNARRPGSAPPVSSVAGDFFSRELAAVDAQVDLALAREEQRQRGELELIAPKNYMSRAARQALASIIAFTSVEGYPGERWHAGTANLDEIEDLAASRARQLFRCGYANVQPHSGTQANQAVFFALLEPGDTVLSMSLPEGGHLSHGDPDNLSGRWFRTLHYGVREDDGLIDYDEMEAISRRERPRLIIVGGSSYPRAIDFARCHEIARSAGAHLLADIAHFSGLVAAGVYPNPFPHVDVVTTSTNKNLRGPRGGLILCDNGEIASKLHRGVFPGVQGGPLPRVHRGEGSLLR